MYKYVLLKKNTLLKKSFCVVPEILHELERIKLNLSNKRKNQKLTLN